MFGHDQLFVGSADVLVVGGIESMFNVPYLLVRVCGGYCMGYGCLIICFLMVWRMFMSVVG